MKTLIIPTDFSPLSKRVLDFAVHLAAQIDAGIMPLCSYFVPYTSKTYTTSLVDIFRENAEQAMEEFVKQIPRNVPCQRKVTPLPLKEELKTLGKDIENTWIIMATYGEKDWWNHQLGTNASHIINSMNSPVILIPENAKCTFPIRHILVATDGVKMTEKVRARWLDMKTTLNASSQALQVVTAQEEEGIGEFEGMPLYKLFHETFKQGLLEAEEIIHPELSLAVHHKRTWFGGLFHSSVSKGLTMNHNAPFVVLQE